MSAATVLFMDIVRFSQKPTPEQRRLVTALTSEVKHRLADLLPVSKRTANEFVALPTGDGMALAFVHHPQREWRIETIMSLVLHIQEWAEEETAKNGSVSLRFGVHVGPVELITDINSNLNLCGDTINYAQRVMDAANPRQVLFSDSAFREHIGFESRVWTKPPFSEKLTAEFHGPIEVYAKHGLRILVYKMTLNPPHEYWFNDDPVAKHLMLVSLTPLPKEIVGTFSERVQVAESIAFIQITGDRFLQTFEEGKITLSPSLKRFWVLMPDPKSYSGLRLQVARSPAELVTEYVDKWKAFFNRLKEKHADADFKLGLFKEPPYFGASFLDWDKPGGKIHVSPYVWSVLAKDCPGYDLEWIGRRPSGIYEVYVRGLEYLNAKTVNVAVN